MAARDQGTVIVVGEVEVRVPLFPLRPGGILAAVARGTGGQVVARARRALVLVLSVLVVGAPAGLLAQAGPVAAGSAGTPLAWVMPSTVRIPSWSAPGHRTAASIEALRGETESFQVAVRAVGGPLSGVSMTVSPLVGPVGSRIGGRSIALFREQYVRVPHHSPAWSGRPVAWPSFPDALVPFVDPVTGRRPDRGARISAYPFGVAIGHVQPVWVDVTVPRSAAPGRYTGSWTVTSRQGSRSGTVALQVRDATLPVTPTPGRDSASARPATVARPSRISCCAIACSPLRWTPVVSRPWTHTASGLWTSGSPVAQTR